MSLTIFHQSVIEIEILEGRVSPCPRGNRHLLMVFGRNCFELPGLFALIENEAPGRFSLQCAEQSSCGSVGQNVRYMDAAGSSESVSDLRPVEFWIELRCDILRLGAVSERTIGGCHSVVSGSSSALNSTLSGLGCEPAADSSRMSPGTSV